MGAAGGLDTAMNTALVLIDELDGAFSNASAARRAEIVGRIADLFLFGAADYSGDQINLFDDVFTRLVTGIESSARAALAERLAANAFSPPGITRALAFDDAIQVAAPVLEFSPCIDSRTLAENARSKSQDHLLAMSRRRELNAAVTDVLVVRGNRPVLLTTVRNSGARLSDFGFMTVVERADGDDELAMCVGERRELPRHYLLKLLTKASRTVRTKLELADPLSSEAIRNAVAGAATIVQARTAIVARDYTAARAVIEELQAAGRLAESNVERFAQSGKFEETVVALALLCELPIEQIELAMAGDRPETVIILAKAIGMSWPTVKALLTMRSAGQGHPDHVFEQCLGTFSRLKPATARQVLEFQRRRAASASRQNAG